MRFAVALLLCFACGCLAVPEPKPPAPPRPDVAGATEMDRYFNAFRMNIGEALSKTAIAIDGKDPNDDGTDDLTEEEYRDVLAANLLDAVTKSHAELSQVDQALSNSGYRPAKAKELLIRRAEESRRGQ
jgi:hypothetical protein